MKKSYLLLLLVTVFSLVACNSDEEKETTVVSKETPTEEIENIEETTEKSEPIQKEVRFGETIELVDSDENYNLTIEAEVKDAFFTGNGPTSLNDSNNFVVIKVLVENIGDAPLNSYPFALDLRLFSPLRLYDEDLKEIEGRYIDRFEDISDVQPEFNLVEVLPGGKNEGYLVYSFDKESIPSQIIFENQNGIEVKETYTYKFE